MHIKRIELTNFGFNDETGESVYQGASLELPESGLVLITGENGSGKSLLVVESVGQAVWGKPVRRGGAMAWNPGETTEIFVETDTISARRVRKGAKTQLKWWLTSQGEDSAVIYDTVTKAQAPLLDLVGRFDTWVHSSVFSAAGMSHFTQASSGDRQRYLETLLHLTKFDRASEKCKARVVTSDQRLRGIETELASVIQKISHEHQRVRDAEEALKEYEPVEGGPTSQDVAEEAAKIDRLDRRINQLLAGMRDAHGKTVGIRAQLGELRRRLDFLQREKCPTCGQDIAKEVRNEIQHACEQLQSEYEEQNETSKRESDGLQGEVDALAAERKRLEEGKTQMKAEIRSAQASTKALLSHKRILEAASEKISDLETQKDQIQQNLEQETSEMKVLRAAELVLGLRGVRSHVLSETLHGIEAIGNNWLDKFCTAGKYQVQLSPYRETKDGGVVNGIDLSVKGAGGGHGYGSCSDGQRRRIDLALLFANAEIAASVSGQDPGTLIIDEAVDGLDQDGVGVFAEIVKELSADRAVVVISHRPDLAAVLNPDCHIRVENGKLITS